MEIERAFRIRNAHSRDNIFAALSTRVDRAFQFPHGASLTSGINLELIAEAIKTDKVVSDLLTEEEDVDSMVFVEAVFDGERGAGLTRRIHILFEFEVK